MTTALLAAGVVPSVAGEPAIRDKPFDIQQGTIAKTRTVKGPGMSQKVVETLYFKDWGRTRATYSTETTNSAAGTQVARKLAILEGTTLTSINLDTLTGTRMANPLAEGFASMNRQQATAMTNKMAAATNTSMKPAGQATVAGKTCEVTESVTAMGPIKQTSRICLWNNILLRSESKGMGMETLEEATSIDTGAVPEAKFRLPAGSKISEIKLP